MAIRKYMQKEVKFTNIYTAKLYQDGNVTYYDPIQIIGNYDYNYCIDYVHKRDPEQTVIDVEIIAKKYRLSIEDVIKHGELIDTKKITNNN